MPQREAEKKRKPRPVRMSDTEYASVVDKAARCAMDVSAFVRAAALAQQIPDRTRDKQINELRRLGGLLKHSFNEGLHEKAQIDPMAFKLLLAELRMAIQRTESAPR